MEYYITAVEDMDERSKTMIGCRPTKEFEIDVGLNQGSALSPFLFIVILDVLTESIGTYPPKAMLFAEDIVICERVKKLEIMQNINLNDRLHVSLVCRKLTLDRPTRCYITRMVLNKDEKDPEAGLASDGWTISRDMKHVT